MANLTQISDNSGGRSLGRSGALIGLVFGAGLGSLRMFLDDSPDAVSIGNLAFLASFVAPFALALGALRLNRATMRAAVWLGCGALGLAGSIVAFSGVSLVLILPGGLLLAAAIQALGARDTSPEWPAALIAVWIVATGVLAFLALFQHEDPRSWTNGNVSYGTSDVITRAEGMTSLGVWLASLVVLATALWLWEMMARRS